MVKYGKQYRKLQLNEWKKYYLDYKGLKHKIRQMKRVLVQDIKVKEKSDRPSLLSTPLLPEEIVDNKDGSNIYNDKKGQHLKEFISLLINEFKKSYNFFLNIEKVLVKKVNSHLYIQTSYSTFTLAELTKEMKSISLTIYLAKCLNAFINDITMAIKKILKKFDKHFSHLYGLLTPHLILKLLSKDKSELEYFLQFKVIDEISTIIESSALDLKRYFDQNTENDAKTRGEFIAKYNEVLKYIKDIDELIYFKTQYKDWIDYISKKKYKKGTKYSENDIFNPILSASYYKDNLLDKFLSTKDAFNEIKNIQRKITLVNKRNIILIITQAFFYNTLLTCIFPILFYNFDIKKSLDNIYIFIIVATTYVGQWCSTFFFYNCMSIKKIKFSYIICYSLIFAGSLIYILSIFNKGLPILILGISRFLVGLGSNPMMGKKYLTLYTPKYLLPALSKIYLIIELSGLILGPCFAALVIFIFQGEPNCIGYYGAIVSILLLLINQLFMTSPGDQNFSVVENQTKEDVNMSTSQYISNNFEDDDEQDKEFYQMQKEKKDRKSAGLEPTRSDDIKIEVKENETTKSNVGLNNTASNPNFKDEKDEDTDYNKIMEGQNEVVENYYNNVDTGRYSDVDLTSEQRDTIKEIEAKLYEYQEKSNFTYIDMMPRTLEDIILNEQKTFGYMNKNFIIILLLLLSNNLIKENLIIYSAFYLFEELDFKIAESEKKVKKEIICLIISAELLLQLSSLLFIMPFYKVNIIFKKNLILFMIGSIVFMIPLLILPLLENQYPYVYIPIASIDILIHKIIEVICSSFLVYLIPPQWKYAHIKASSLPIYLMTLGKIIACTFCFLSQYNNVLLNGFSICAYLIFGIIIYKSTNFRVKALTRILRRKAIQ